MTVAGRIDPIRGGVIPTRDMTVRADARGPFRGIEPRDQRLRVQIERRLHQARVYAAALAGALPAEERGEDAHREQRRAMVVDRGHAHRARTASLLPGDRQDAE